MTSEIFVPGRVCILGEHSDWAGGHRKTNPDIPVGKCIVYGTSCGMHARVQALEHRSLRFRSALNDEAAAWHEFPLDPLVLNDVAKEGKFFAYVCGVASVIVERFPNMNGVEIDNYDCDMPIRKGLSSSAAICVLVAKAFDELYQMRWTTEEIMDLAYCGELRTPSKCGRMDQCVAFGRTGVLMEFDGFDVRCTPLQLGGRFFFVVADLGAAKDTMRILRDLQQAYPFPASSAHQRVHDFLGDVSAQQVERTTAALAAGDAARLGAIMIEFQRLFDEHLAPQCPAELSAPRLHQILSNDEVKRLSLGGKGVGSQGDGSVQFVCADETHQRELVAHLESLGCTHVMPMIL
jgi:galactokinase